MSIIIKNCYYWFVKSLEMPRKLWEKMKMLKRQGKISVQKYLVYMDGYS
jgi:hypothetical protein